MLFGWRINLPSEAHGLIQLITGVVILNYNNLPIVTIMSNGCLFINQRNLINRSDDNLRWIRRILSYKPRAQVYSYLSASTGFASAAL